MSERKHEHLVKPLSIAAAMANMPENMETRFKLPPSLQGFRGPGNADSIVWPNGKEHLEGLKLNFSWGFYTGEGPWHPGMDPHTHPYPEALVYVGLDPDNMDYLGAEIQYCLGKEVEVYNFDKPTVIIVPAGLPHCPSITKKVTNPKGYSFFIISLGEVPNSIWMGEDVSEEDMKMMQEMMAKSGAKISMISKAGKKKIKAKEENMTHGDKYARFVKPLKSPSNRPGPGNPDKSLWLTGSDLESLSLNFSWGYYSKSGIWDADLGMHSHPIDEVMVFVGLDPDDIDYLGAEIEVDLGKEHEKYTFNKPTAVIYPAGFPHSTIEVKRVDKSYAVYLISLGAEHETSPEN